MIHIIDITEVEKRGHSWAVTIDGVVFPVEMTQSEAEVVRDWLLDCWDGLVRIGGLSNKSTDTERLDELVSKVSHGYNLINSEAREVLEHFGVEVEQRKRCGQCEGSGYLPPEQAWDECPSCNGTGYEVRK